jgi:hypothetical protein
MQRFKLDSLSHVILGIDAPGQGWDYLMWKYFSAQSIPVDAG